MIDIKTCLQFILVLIPVWLHSYAEAETIILNSGEKFTSANVWEEDGKIRFNMNGLIVRVDKKDVAAVIRDDGTPILAPQPLPPPVMDGRKASDPGQPQLKPEIDSTPIQPQPDPTQRPETPRSTARRPSTSDALPSATKQVRGIGHKDLAWKMRPGDIPGLVKMETDQASGDIDQYYRPAEPLALHQARLDGIIYGFWRNRLYSIMYWVDGPRGYAALKKAVVADFGSGTRSSSGLERYIWRSPDTDRMLEFDNKLNTGIFWMRSRELDSQMKQLSPQ
jgi:hypothetical protein